MNGEKFGERRIGKKDEKNCIFLSMGNRYKQNKRIEIINRRYNIDCRTLNMPLLF
jgi:hypothetical protein